MNILKLKNIIAAMALAIICVGCGSDDDNNTPKPPSNNAHFTFLKVGHEWVYEVNGNPNDIATRKIVSVNDGLYKFSNTDSYLTGTTTDYWYGNNDYWKINISEPTSAGLILLYSNYKVGQKWDINSSTSGEVLSVSEMVSVPAGTYPNCIKVQITYSDPLFGDGYYYYWIRTDIGIIKLDEGFIMELKSKNF